MTHVYYCHEGFKESGAWVIGDDISHCLFELTLKCVLRLYLHGISTFHLLLEKNGMHFFFVDYTKISLGTLLDCFSLHILLPFLLSTFVFFRYCLSLTLFQLKGPF